MDIKIGGTNDSAYESLKAKNSQKNAQKTDTQETVEKDNKSMKSANNIDLAAKYVSSQGDTVEKNALEQAVIAQQIAEYAKCLSASVKDLKDNLDKFRF
ncbi:hypothetical protein [Clostridium thailandense]|uniref:hypothetical protein n=1 Tax=Clostridium thailandense TaxID=2794346 RepID=UPI00398991C3